MDQPATEVLPGRYRHFKGGLYEVLGVAVHSETREALVVYRPQYGDRPLMVRPLAMFVEQVRVNETLTPRFRYLGPDAADPLPAPGSR